MNQKKNVTVYVVSIIAALGLGFFLGHSFALKGLARGRIDVSGTSTGRDLQEEFEQYKEAILSMHNIVTGIECYRAEHGEPTRDLNELIPEYLNPMSFIDPWGEAYIYEVAADGTAYLGCGGNDGRFGGFDQTGSFTFPAKGADLIFIDGMLVLGPEVQGE